MLPSHLVCWPSSPGAFLWTEPVFQFLPLELTKAGESHAVGKPLSCPFLTFISQLISFNLKKKMTGLTSQLHCSKCERTLRVKNANLSGVWQGIGLGTRV